MNTEGYGRRTLILIIVSIAALTLVSGCTTCPDIPMPWVSPTPVVTPIPGMSITVTFIDVGQGSSVLIQSPDANILVDGGEREYGAKIVDYLKSIGVNRLNAVIATHPDSDHIGGLITVLKQMPVDAVYDNGQISTTATYRDFLQAVVDKDIPYNEVTSPQLLNIGQTARVEALGPTLPLFEGSDADNNNGIILKVTYGDFSCLITGDAGFDAEKRIMDKDTSSTVLTVAHHGSKYATSGDFLDKVRPQIAVIPVGPNDYGHPTLETLGRLSQRNIPVYRTDLKGTITITSDGTTYTVATERD